MTIDTSREVAEQLTERLRNPLMLRKGDYDRVADTLAALLAERDAALAEVARLSTPPDDAEVTALVGWLRNPWLKATAEAERGPIPEWIHALLQGSADALTRLSHALALLTQEGR